MEINAEYELFQLKTTLVSRGLSDDEADDIVGRAREEIQSYAKEAMSSALVSAVSAGIQNPSANFIKELRPNFDAFTIDTESGNTDFTIPPFPMRDNLLKNPKIAKDGSLYKVIPVGKPGGLSQKMKMQASTAATQVLQGAAFSAQLDQQRNEVLAGTPGGNATKLGEQQIYRTVSSKQPLDAWTHPGFNKDFTGQLGEINSALQEDIANRIRSIVKTYESQGE